MGCVYSRVEREEAVRRCRERRRLMKHLVGCRARFAAAHLAYLQSLRNTGATLRQFAEADSSIAPGDAASVTTTGGRRIRPPPSPPPLPPSPPPLPPFSPEEEARGFPFPPRGRRICREQEETTVGDESDGDETRLPPPPPPEHGSAWGLWDPFDSSPPELASPVTHKNAGAAYAAGAAPPATEEEDWEETKTEFDDEEDFGEENPTAAAASIGAEAVGLSMVTKGKLLPGRGDVVGDDNSSAVSSLFTKETDSSMVLWRSRRSLAGIARDLDDYFLKASAGGTKVAALLESHRGCSLHQLFEETEGRNFKSAKVFSTLSWRWSLRSLPSGGPDCPPGAAINARQPGRHSTTLDRLFAEEQKLYKEVKEEETRKLEFGKKVALLRKQEARGQDWTITARTRLSMEELQTEIVSLQESIGRTCSSISKLRDEELHPQLVELCSGFMEMWRTMYQCHQVQNHIAQQMNHLHGLSAAEPTTESHIQAASQLETEVDTWHSSLHGLLRAQREYAHTLNQWVGLTDCLPAASNGSVGPSRIFRLCEEWQLALDRLPEKVPAEAIKSFISIVQSISSQLAEEHRHQKRSSRLEKRLMRELDSLDDDGDAGGGVVLRMATAAAVNPPPESARRAKMAARRRRAEEEKTKYLSSVSQSRAMMINNLQTSLPNVFQALMGFASVCVPAFEGICRSPEAVAAAAAGGRASGGSSPAR
ncbi:unnamed protein product [Spirodela intermedia]|uniref:Uncharacterized protein n=1 Tax=Spirodela intermedia TaxID=51605 RepID=A0A7I8L4H3_SPIIN|nr:unnamed protein product [Spirodela intermedia]